MANTERLNTIAQIREAKNSIGIAKLNPALSDDQRLDLITLFWKLDEVEGKLILNEVSQQVAILTADAEALKGIADGMQTTIDELRNVAKNVKKAAEAIGVLVQIAELVAGAVA
jgi:hypothetical protein